MVICFKLLKDRPIDLLYNISEIIGSPRFEASIIALCNISPSCEITSSWAACVQSRRHVWESWSGRWRAKSRRKRTAGACWRMFSQTRPLLAALSPRTVLWRTSWLSYRMVLSKWWGWPTCCPSVFFYSLREWKIATLKPKSIFYTDQWEHGADQRHPVRAACEKGAGSQNGRTAGGTAQHQGAGVFSLMTNYLTKTVEFVFVWRIWTI